MPMFWDRSGLQGVHCRVLLLGDEKRQPHVPAVAIGEGSELARMLQAADPGHLLQKPAHGMEMMVMTHGLLLNISLVTAVQSRGVEMQIASGVL